jgi:hypothetical protein
MDAAGAVGCYFIHVDRDLVTHTHTLTVAAVVASPLLALCHKQRILRKLASHPTIRSLPTTSKLLSRETREL